MSSSQFPDTHPLLFEIASTEEVVVVRGSTASKSHYHAYHDGDHGPEPACGTDAGAFTTWSLEQAQAWREPCKRCFDLDGESQ